MVSKRAACLTAMLGTLLATLPALAQSPAHDFVPDFTFKGSRLTGWHTLGQADWRAENGEIIGTGRAGGPGGWLILDKSYQDVAVFARLRCAAPCKTGVLLRAHKTADGMQGTLVSLADGDFGPYRVTLDAGGRELSRDRLRPGPTQIRIAPPPPATPPTPPATPPQGAAGAGASGVGGLAGATAATTGGGQGVAGPFPPANVRLTPLLPPAAGIRPGEWNEISIMVDANILRPNLNGGNQIGTGTIEDSSAGYGPIALYVGGSSEVRFKDVSLKDLNLRKSDPEKVSSRFTMQRLDEFYYAWDAAVGDVNHDGIQDVIAGPYYYLGPDFTTRREIYLAQTYSPSTQYSSNMVTYAHDFTGDGWVDVLATESRPMVLYVNPKGENRRWDRNLVLPGVTTEITLVRDVNADGRPDIVYGTGGALAYATYDPANPTAPWSVHRIAEPGFLYAHGLGGGDINGDGRMDLLQPDGWWEQPASLAGDPLWTYHPEAFARWSRSEGAGGGEMAVQDMNGDGLNDVVTSLNAHGWGLAWFEQKKDAGGRISFERHMIMDDFSTRNAGGVTFSEMHAGVQLVDVDGDGLLDIVTGKRFWAHRESYTDPDPNGAAVLYWYRAVRSKTAAGGVEFVPELIHNRSGVGSHFATADLNNDGAVDIVTSASRGTFIFWGTKRAK